MILISALAVCAVSLGPAKGELDYEGMYVEGCSCAAPCPCELTGVEMGCEGVGGFSVTRGTYNGQSISGVRFAYAVAPGSWVTCYVDAPAGAKRNAATALVTDAFKSWGEMGPVKYAAISIAGANGRYALKVNGGATMSLTTEPVLGGNKKSAIEYHNINSVLHPIVMQAKVVHCSYKDGEHSFELKDSNAYFNANIKAKGNLLGG